MEKNFLIYFYIIIAFSLKANSESKLPKCESDFYKEWTNCQAPMTYTNGEKYNGEWKDGSIHGYGIYHYEDGSIYSGEFIGGQKNGKGKLIVSIKNERLTL